MKWNTFSFTSVEIIIYSIHIQNGKFTKNYYLLDISLFAMWESIFTPNGQAIHNRKLGHLKRLADENSSKHKETTIKEFKESHKFIRSPRQNWRISCWKLWEVKQPTNTWTRICTPEANWNRKMWYVLIRFLSYNNWGVGNLWLWSFARSKWNWCLE